MYLEQEVLGFWCIPDDEPSLFRSGLLHCRTIIAYEFEALLTFAERPEWQDRKKVSSLQHRKIPEIVFQDALAVGVIYSTQ